MRACAQAGTWLSKRRSAAEITQGELAEMLLVDEQTVAQAEAGAAPLGDPEIARAARVFGLAPAEFADWYRARLGITKAAA